MVEQETICLHPKDAISIKLWMDRLQEMEINVFYKDKLTPPPPASKLQRDTLILCVQTPFQMDAFWCLRNGGFIGIDATHNLTYFPDVLLFMIIARDRWGHGSYVIAICGCWAEALELQCQHQAPDRMSRVCVYCGVVRVKIAAEKRFSSLVLIASLQVCNTVFHP